MLFAGWCPALATSLICKCTQDQDSRYVLRRNVLSLAEIISETI